MSRLSKFDLDGKSALITGASSGLGRHFADLLSSCGAKVALCARRLDRLEQAVAEIEKNGGRALAYEVDVTREADVTNAFERADQEFNGIDHRGL